MFVGCESSSMNNPKDYNDTTENNNSVDENITIPIEDENLTIPIEDENTTEPIEEDNNATTPIEDENLTQPIEDENLTTPVENNNSSTNLRCYFIYDEQSYGFIDSSNLVKSYSTNTILGGQWSDTNFENSTQNYFILKSIDNKDVNESDIDDILVQRCKDVNENSEYTNIKYITSQSSDIYEFPILTPSEDEDTVDSYNADIFDYKKILRYAYAVSYLYDNNDTNRSDINNTIKEDIFLIDNKVIELDRVEDNISNQYLSVAIKAPKVTTDNLDTEIIIAYKGSDNLNTAVSNSELERGYDFYKKVTTTYPPCKTSYSKEFDDNQTDKECYNIVLTGEKMGALIAIGVAQRTGISTRVFYGFGDDLLESYTTEFNTKLRLDSVINFYSSDVELVESSGEHLENIVKFSSLDNEYTNSIDGIIKEILEPLYENNTFIEPIDMYLLPSILVGSGLDKRVDIWGLVK
jgi:hypothetical protein